MRISLKHIILFILVLGLIVMSGYYGYKFSLVEKHTEIKKEVLLERIKNVIKLGTVEGVFSEIYNYSDYYYYDISPFRKKALIRIRATVLVGYNLDSFDIKINQFNKKVIIRGFTGPEILSIDHEMDYYDITEGSFNTFTKEDYNMLQKQSKDFIRKKAEESDLFESADRQLQEHISLLEWLLKESGWEIIVLKKRKTNILG